MALILPGRTAGARMAREAVGDPRDPDEWRSQPCCGCPGMDPRPERAHHSHTRFPHDRPSRGQPLPACHRAAHARGTGRDRPAPRSIAGRLMQSTGDSASTRTKDEQPHASGLSENSLNELRESLSGRVLGPADAGYDAARVCFNALIDRRPAVIAQCAGAGDGAAAFDFARAHDLQVAVRGGGHNPAGHCILDGGLVVDLSPLRAVEVEADDRIARAGGGSTWIDFDSATQAHGLVTPGGVVGSTGVCGLALGGGIGHLTAQYGLTCDSLIGAELVTPDGRVVHASSDENRELLWGLRGAGGNFGVAIRLHFRLYPLDSVVGGLLVFGGKDVRDALRRFREVVARSPRELSCQAVLSVDDALAPSLVLALCYTGSARESSELHSLRSGPGLRAYGVRERSFLEQQRLLDSPYGQNRHYWKGHFVEELPDELLDVLLERVVALGRRPGDILIESLHGAPKDADAGTGAVGFRRAAFNIS